MCKTEIWDVVKAYASGGRDSTVLTVPQPLCEKMGVELGQKFVVKTDEEGRIIFVPKRSEISKGGDEVEE